MNTIKRWTHGQSPSQARDQPSEEITEWVTVPYPFPYNLCHTSNAAANRAAGVHLVLFPDPTAASTVPLYKPSYAGAGETGHSVPWCANIDIKVENLPALQNLMKHSLDLSENSVDVLDECFFPCSGWDLNRGWTHFRQSRLRSTAVGKPKWTALLKVYARTVDDQCNFDVRRLSVENVRYIHAWDEQYTRVYCYDPVLGEDNRNDVYEAVPMQAWWPWAKWWPREGHVGVVSVDGCE